MSWRYPTVIAHRCGGALAPENTLAGLRVAARLGVKAVEFDAMLSADGIPVLIHDDTLERTTNGHGNVATTPLAALQQLDAGNFHHPAFGGEQIPTLAAALDLCNTLGLAVNLEIKPSTGQDEATATAIVDVVKAHPVAAGVLFSSFSLPALRIVHTALPNVPRAWLVTTPPVDWAAELAALSAIALHCPATAVTPALLATASTGGWVIACYTINTAAQAQSLWQQGVASVFSDRPERLL